MGPLQIKIAPSILSADFRILESQVKTVEAGGADLIHCDIMDGHFVPNISFGPLVVAAVKQCTRLPLGVHLMISNPRIFIDPFVKAGASRIIIHVEIRDNISELLRIIAERGIKTGISLNPATPLDSIRDFLPQCDEVLVMTVSPGFGGQPFLPDQLSKIKDLQQAIAGLNRPVEIAVDGGITEATAAQCVSAGATVLVAGNYIFAAADPARRIALLRKNAQV
ncbi:MAG: ribulose-phosphate 3-epimerase [Chitinivibrionales bacterium]|nr:ribulose-phosphate 3-epimerase [Chitinivibrionales bacterium]